MTDEETDVEKVRSPAKTVSNKWTKYGKSIMEIHTALNSGETTENSIHQTCDKYDG